MTLAGCNARPGMAVRAALAALMAIAVASCGPMIPPHGGAGAPPLTGPVAPPPPQNALSVGVAPGPDIATLAIGQANAGAALAAFREACPRAGQRNDTSGLTRTADWRAVCDAAMRWPFEQAASFFAANFETAIVGNGTATVTGYFEPEIAGVRTHQPGYDVPVYGVPPDLVHARPGDAPVKPNGQTPFGRYDANGRFGPYYERSQIEAGALAGQGLEIAWAQDPVAFFFLQVQGSGRLRAPDGSIIRIGYAADNGQDYTGIGAVMRQQGLIGTGPGQYPGSMQGIVQYIHDQPAAGHALMDLNKSWVFFREITGDGPIGAMGVPVRGHISVAADPLFTPLGAPVLLRMDPALAGATAANGLWVAEDTGGAIKGANRFDSFWGAGPDAQRIAGGMFGHGQALILLPRGTLARLAAAGMIAPQRRAPDDALPGSLRPALPAYAPPGAGYAPAPYTKPYGAPPPPYAPAPQPYVAPPRDPSVGGPPLDAGD